MDKVYLYCAIVGGAILVIQVLMLLIGGGDSDFDSDVSPDVDAGEIEASSVLFQLSLKTVVAFVTFFGLVGLSCLEAGVTPTATLLSASGAGLGAFFLVGYLMSVMTSLQSAGNADLATVVGQHAKVYLRIPPRNTGSGKITVVVGGRRQTQKAVTKGDEIPTGAEVIIRGMTAPDTFEVSLTQ